MSQNRSHAVMAQRAEPHDSLESMCGKQFGDWTVLRVASNKKRGRYVECRCKCGALRAVRADHLVSGASKSCGRGLCSANTSRVTHGYARRGSNRRHEYSAWSDAKKRCTNPKATHYEYYGGRGIAMCERWLSSFAAFLADMGDCPAGMTLDRIDSDGNYEPGNCRWVPMLMQNRNRRSSVVVEFEGEKMTLAEMAERHCVSYKALHYEHRQKMLPLADALARAKARKALERASDWPADEVAA